MKTKQLPYWYLEYLVYGSPRVSVYRSYADAKNAEQYVRNGRVVGPVYFEVPV